MLIPGRAAARDSAKLKPFTALSSILVPAALAATSISLSLTLLNGGGTALQPLPLAPAVDSASRQVAAILEAPTRVLSPSLRQAAAIGTEGASSPAPEASAPKPLRASVQPRVAAPTPPAPPAPPAHTSPPPPSPPAAVQAVYQPPLRSHVHGKAKAFGLNKPRASEHEHSGSPHGKAKGQEEEPLLPAKLHEPKMHDPGALKPKGPPTDKKPKGGPAPQAPTAPQAPEPKDSKDKGGSNGNGGGKK